MPWSLGGTSSTMSVTGFTPASATAPGDATSTVQLAITGTGFPAQALVWLEWNGQPVIKATGVTVTGTTRVTCTVDLTGWTVTGAALGLNVGVGNANFSEGAWAPQSFVLTAKV